MQLGLATYSYHLAFGKHPDRRADGPMTLAKCLKRARDLGFSAVQVDPAHFNPEKDSPKWVRKLADSLGLALEAGSIGVDPERLGRDLGIAAEWNSPVLRTSLAWEHPRVGGHPEERLRKAAEKLRESLAEAERLKITIAIENHGDISTPDLLALLKMTDSPYVGVCLDVGNSMLFLEDPVWTAEQLAPWAVTAHLKDYRRVLTTFGGKCVGVPLGEGNIDLDRVIPVLLAAPRLAHLMLESATEATGSDSEMLAAEDRAVVKSVEFWKQWMHQHPQS